MDVWKHFFCTLINCYYYIVDAPVIKGRLTNEKITCDCNGVPEMYSVYRLDHDSENGKLVRSVNLNNESFPFKMEMFAYQKNGRYTCVVSNGIPDNNGKVLQTWSTYFKYEGKINTFKMIAYIS